MVYIVNCGYSTFNVLQIESTFLRSDVRLAEMQNYLLYLKNECNKTRNTCM